MTPRIHLFKNGEDDTSEAEAIASEPVLVLLSTIAPELQSSPTVDSLARRLGDDVILDDIGRRCVTAELATLLLDDDRNRRAAADDRRAQHAERARLAPRRHVQPLLPPGTETGGLSPAEFLMRQEIEESTLRAFDRYSPDHLDEYVSVGPERRPRSYDFTPRKRGAK